MKILWVATKAPWPPVDGGRLLLWNTLAALRADGVDVTLVAPHLGPSDRFAACRETLYDVCTPILVPSKLPSALASLLRAELRSRPWSVVRHQNPEVRHRVGAELAKASRYAPYDVVVAEQLQALAQIPPGGKVPVVLRAENVESDLWHAFAAVARPPSRWWLTRQARALALEEGRVVRKCAMTAALTDHDAKALRSLAEAEGSVNGPVPIAVTMVPAIVDVDLPAGQKLKGEPAVVLFGSRGWKPNAEGARSFVGQAWAEIRRRNPGAMLHLFGDLMGEPAPADGLRLHPSPDDSATALAAGSILAVPLAVASGVRMKILEAWARGVAVVASPAAARGLEAEAGRELSVAESAEEWAEAVSQTARLYDERTTAARRRLRETYAAEKVAARWRRLFETLAPAAE